MKLQISTELALPRDAVTQTMLVLGGKGMGKTNFAAVLAEEMNRARLRFAWIDPMGVAWGLRHSKDGRGEGLEVLILGGRHGDLPIEPTGSQVVADLVADEDADVIIDISRRKDGKMWSIGERIRFVADYCTRLYERQGERTRPILQIIDEAARFVPQQIPHGSFDIARCAGALSTMTEEGRNVGIGICLITQRSARISKAVSELADCMIAFRTIGPLSAGAILDWLGDHVEKNKLKDLSEKIRSLARGSALIVSPGWLSFEGVVPIRARQTFDSSATPKAGEEKSARGAGKKPDLARYQERMAATIERAKAEDPAELKKRIGDLEKRLAQAVKTPVLRASDTLERKEIADRAIAAAVKEAKDPLIRQITSMRQAAARTQTAITRAADEIRSAVEASPLTFEAEHSRKQSNPARPQAAGSVPAAPTDHGSRGEIKVKWPTAAEIDPNGTKLPPGERNILVALAQYGDTDRTELTVLTGYKRSSRDQYLRLLAQKGYAEVRTNGTAAATPAGITALGSYEQLPTGRALYEFWKARLTSGELKILEYLVDTFAKETIEREQIDAPCGLKRSSRDQYLRLLASRRLVEFPGTGTVKAAAALFGGHAQ